MRTIFTLLLSALALSFTSSAYSTGLSGNLVRMAHNYPAPGTVYGNYQDAIVGVGIEGDFFLPFYTVDISDNAIRVDFPGSGTFDASGFNGLQVQDVNGAISDFRMPSLVSTSLPGFDSSKILYDVNNVYLDFSGLNPAGGEFIIVGVSLVPEPSIAMLAFPGLLLVAVIARVRRR